MGDGPRLSDRGSWRGLMLLCLVRRQTFDSRARLSFTRFGNIPARIPLRSAQTRPPPAGTAAGAAWRPPLPARTGLASDQPSDPTPARTPATPASAGGICPWAECPAHAADGGWSGPAEFPVRAMGKALRSQAPRVQARGETLPSRVPPALAMGKPLQSSVPPARRAPASVFC